MTCKVFWRALCGVALMKNCDNSTLKIILHFYINVNSVYITSISLIFPHFSIFNARWATIELRVSPIWEKTAATAASSVSDSNFEAITTEKEFIADENANSSHRFGRSNYFFKIEYAALLVETTLDKPCAVLSSLYYL